MASSTASDPAKKVSTGADHPVIKAGCWFWTSRFPVENIDSKRFTHLYAGFANVQYPIPPSENINDDVIIFPDSIFETFPKTVKRANPDVKALLSIGSEGPNDISAIASVAENAIDGLRTAFINKSIKLARENNYDGLDLCWLYPSDANQQNDLVSLLKDWRLAVDNDARDQPSKLILTATVFHHPSIPGTDGNISNKYSVDDLLQNLDWINVLAIDFYTPASWQKKTGPVHAWVNLSSEKTKSGSDGIKDWIPSGDKAGQQFVLALPFYGYKWILNDPNASGFFAPAHPDPDQRITPVSYSTIEEEIEKGNYETNYDSTYVATYARDKQKGNWFGYDDERSIKEKVRQAIDRKCKTKVPKLRGYLAWNVGGDDSEWTLSDAASGAADAVNQ